MEMLGGVFGVSLLQLFALTSATICITVFKQHKNKHIEYKYNAAGKTARSERAVSGYTQEREAKRACCVGPRAADVPFWAAR